MAGAGAAKSMNTSMEESTGEGAGQAAHAVQGPRRGASRSQSHVLRVLETLPEGAERVGAELVGDDGEEEQQRQRWLAADEGEVREGDGATAGSMLVSGVARTPVAGDVEAGVGSGVDAGVDGGVGEPLLATQDSPAGRLEGGAGSKPSSAAAAAAAAGAACGLTASVAGGSGPIPASAAAGSHSPDLFVAGSRVASASVQAERSLFEPSESIFEPPAGGADAGFDEGGEDGRNGASSAEEGRQQLMQRLPKQPALLQERSRGEEGQAQGHWEGSGQGQGQRECWDSWERGQGNGQGQGQPVRKLQAPAFLRVSMSKIKARIREAQQVMQLAALEERQAEWDQLQQQQVRQEEGWAQRQQARVEAAAAAAVAAVAARGGQPAAAEAEDPLPEQRVVVTLLPRCVFTSA